MFVAWQKSTSDHYILHDNNFVSFSFARCAARSVHSVLFAGRSLVSSTGRAVGLFKQFWHTSVILHSLPIFKQLQDYTHYAWFILGGLGKCVAHTCITTKVANLKRGRKSYNIIIRSYP